MSENRQFLYRYRHLNGQHRDWTKRIFTESVLRFANPSTFNDPFDCKVHYLSSFSVEELRRQHLDRIKRRMPDLNRKQRRAKVTQDIGAMEPKKFLRQVTDGLQNAVNGVGVLSLSATDRNILLWSHYAEGHTGLCLKFLATDQTPFFGRALPVNYVTSYPEIPITSPADKQIEAFLLTKAIDWRYEEEYRIIDHDHGAGDKAFPAELLVGVILGARMTPNDKTAVVEWVSKRECHMEVLEASVASGSFSLEIRPYEG
ncbi:MAG: DUF2971 domain-containing protein [Pseudomonadota bacterium]